MTLHCTHTPAYSTEDRQATTIRKTGGPTYKYQNGDNDCSDKIKDEELRLTNNFTYLGSIIISEGGTKEDIHSRLGKARRVFRVFREMNNIWRSTQYNTNTKLKLHQSCVVSILLYGSECWGITETDLSTLRSFQTTSIV
jgi:hypothetical protein